MIKKCFVSIHEKNSPLSGFEEHLFKNKKEALTWMNTLGTSDLVVTDIPSIFLDEFIRYKY